MSACGGVSLYLWSHVLSRGWVYLVPGPFLGKGMSRGWVLTPRRWLWATNLIIHSLILLFFCLSIYLSYQQLSPYICVAVFTSYLQFRLCSSVSLFCNSVCPSVYMFVCQYELLWCEFVFKCHKNEILLLDIQRYIEL